LVALEKYKRLKIVKQCFSSISPSFIKIQIILINVTTVSYLSTDPPWIFTLYNITYFANNNKIELPEFFIEMTFKILFNVY